MGYQKTHNFMLIQNFLKYAQNDVPTKVIGKNIVGSEKSENLLTFCRFLNFFWSPLQCNWNANFYDDDHKF